MKSQITLSDMEVKYISTALESYQGVYEGNPSVMALREIFAAAVTSGDSIRLVADHDRVTKFKTVRGED